MKKNKKILITGGHGRFGKILKNILFKKREFIFLKKKELNILKPNQIKKVLLKYKPLCVIHLAGLSRPMILHEKDPCRSISLNIIGTSNLVVECARLNIKIIYFSSQYVYPGTRGNYDESSPVLPMNNYAWSKLGGECAVKMYKNSLILRVNMSERPWVHKYAFKNIKSNFLYHDEVAKILPSLINQYGIVNIGSNNNSILKFAKRTNKLVKGKNYKNKKNEPNMPKNSTLNISKLKKILKKKFSFI